MAEPVTLQSFYDPPAEIAEPITDEDVERGYLESGYLFTTAWFAHHYTPEKDGRRGTLQTLGRDLEVIKMGGGRWVYQSAWCVSFAMKWRLPGIEDDEELEAQQPDRIDQDGTVLVHLGSEIRGPYILYVSHGSHHKLPIAQLRMIGQPVVGIWSPNMLNVFLQIYKRPSRGPLK